MGFDQIVTTGLVALFGGALLWAAIGALVGRFQGFEVGVGTGMILFGITGLVFAAWLAWTLWGGGVVLASALEARRPSATQPVAPWRAKYAMALTVSGNLVLLAGVVLGLVFDDDMVRGTHTMFRSVTIACACWFVASALGGGLKLAQALFFALLGGGFYLASESLRLFGGS
jgi:hypothetical protein